MARSLVFVGLLLVALGGVALLFVWPATVSERGAMRAPVVAPPSAASLVEVEAEELQLPASAAAETRVESTEAALPEAQADAAKLFTLVGRVIDQFDSPVDHVFVTVRGPVEAESRRSAGAVVASMLSGADGRFRFEGLERGAARLQVHGEKLLEAVELSLADIEDEREFELRVRIGRELAVRVRWPDGALADQVYFALANGQTSRGLTSDASLRQEDGTYRLRGLLEGPLDVRVLSERDGRSGRAVASLQVPHREVLELALEELETALRGTVTDTSGRPIEGVRVTLGHLESGAIIEQTTDAAGAFEFLALEPGQAQVSAHSADHVLQPSYRPVTIAPDLPPLELELEAVATVRGQVLDPSGVPVAHARVLGGGAPPKRAEEWTDANGRFALRAAPGRRILYALADGFARAPDRRVWLEPGEVLEDIVLRLRPACRVVGRVLDADGAPAPQATLMVGAGLRTLDAEGEFELDDLPPEPVVFVANDDDGGLAIQEVTPLVGQETHVELRFQPRAPVHLRLHVTDLGRPVEVEATFTTRGFQRRAKSAGGRLELDLQAPGLWRGVLRRSSATRDELAAQFLFELVVPDQDSHATELDLEFLTKPASQDDLAAWLRN